VKRFRGGLVFKAHGLLYHSTLGSRVIKKKKEEDTRTTSTRKRESAAYPSLSGFKVQGLGFEV